RIVVSGRRAALVGQRRPGPETARRALAGPVVAEGAVEDGRRTGDVFSLRAVGTDHYFFGAGCRRKEAPPQASEGGPRHRAEGGYRPALPPPQHETAGRWTELCLRPGREGTPRAERLRAVPRAAAELFDLPDLRPRPRPRPAHSEGPV